jgi:hypothetical protein
VSPRITRTVASKSEPGRQKLRKGLCTLWTDNSDNPVIQAALTRMPNAPAPVLNILMDPPGFPPRFVGIRGADTDSLPGSGSGEVDQEW